jgi:hypothetical protein
VPATYGWLRGDDHHEEFVVDDVDIDDEREFENVLAVVVVDGLLVVGDVDVDLSSRVQRIALTWPAK